MNLPFCALTGCLIGFKRLTLVSISQSDFLFYLKLHEVKLISHFRVKEGKRSE